MSTEHTHSTNARAETLMGRRDEDGPIGILLFEPVEEGFQCPVHRRSFAQESQRLTLFWSEYCAFLWCELCDKDYPSALCATDIDHAIKVFLDSVSHALRRSGNQT